jgi:pyrimidine deaminase RibD-like protein
LLEQYGELVWWEEAVKQAQRCTFKRHRTGVVIVDKRGTLRARGCSHKRDGYKANSMHAEQHAIGNFYDGPSLKCYCIIVTLTKVSNFASCSRPCYDCAYSLQNNGLDVIYAERTNNGGWAIREVPFDLLTEGYLKPTKYA